MRAVPGFIRGRECRDLPANCDYAAHGLGTRRRDGVNGRPIAIEGDKKESNGTKGRDGISAVALPGLVSALLLLAIFGILFACSFAEGTLRVAWPCA